MKEHSPFTEKKYIPTLIFVTSLFMFWGMAITLGDILNKHFQNVLQVNKFEATFVQFCIFGAYAVMAVPAGLFMKRFGYKRGVLFGLSLYAGGAFLFVPSAFFESFPFFLTSLFILACGLATLETVAHPFVASLGVQKTSDQRINFAQSFNGLGTMIGPFLGTYFMFGDTSGTLDSVKMLYTSIGVVITVLAISFSFVKVPPVYDAHEEETAEGNHNSLRILFQKKHFVWAVIAQFFNVGAQAGTWALFINYGTEIAHLTDKEAGYFHIGFMGMMMLGRFVGTFLMRFIAPNKLLAIFAGCNIILAIVAAQAWGINSFVALICINFFFSIMFPTIFSLGLKDLGSYTKQGSSFIVMGVVGGAFFPLLMGGVAESYGTASAYYLPIISYVIIFLFGYKFYKVVR